MPNKCIKCGNELRDGAKFCSKCGAQQAAVQPQVQPQQPVRPAVQPDESKPQEKPKKSKARLIALIVCLLVIGAAVAVILIFFNPFKDKNEGWKVAVPDVINTEYEKAQDTLTESTLHGLIYDKTESSDTAENNVVNQNPKAKEVVYKGSIVDLVVSAGNDKAFLPDVTNYTFEYANKVLTDAGFKVKQEQLSDDEFAPESVGGQSVNSGYVEKGQEVTVKVAPEKDSGSETVSVPDITKKDIETAKAELKKTGLYLAVNIAEYSDAVPENQVISQDKSAGSQAKKGETVLVKISLGKEKVYVPDVTFRTLEKAQKLLEDLGLESEITYEESRTVAKDTVISQGSQPGTAVENGSKVEITVSSGYLVNVPDVVNEKENDAVADILNFGLAVNVIYKKDSSVKKGEVISQSIEGGKEVQLGTVVTIYVSAKEESGEEYIISSMNSSDEVSNTETTTETHVNESSTSNTSTTKPTTTKPTTTKSAEKFCTPSQSDWKKLESELALYNQFHWGYNCKTASTKDILFQIYDGLGSLHPYEYTFENDVKKVSGDGTKEIKDPLNKLPCCNPNDTWSGYATISVDKFNWLAKNIFNINPVLVKEASFTESTDTVVYSYNGKYYFYMCAGYSGDLSSYEYSVKEYTPLDDGKYSIKCTKTQYFIDDIESQKEIEVIAALKEVDGCRIWSFYKVGT